jgi:hypothetical protein
MTRRVGHDSNHEKRCRSGCSTGRNQRQLNTRDRENSDHVTDIDERLTQHPHRRGGGHQPQEWVGRPARDPHSGIGEQPE